MDGKPTRLAVALRLLLASRGIQQQDFAKAVKSNSAVVSRFLTGHNMPTPDVMMRIAAWLIEEDN